jgi:hypothetical protein
MAMFGISPLELLIVGVVALVMLGGAVVPVVLIVYFARKRSPAPTADLAPCPDCGPLLSRQAITCPQCGRPMQSSPIR